MKCDLCGGSNHTTLECWERMKTKRKSKTRAARSCAPSAGSALGVVLDGDELSILIQQCERLHGEMKNRRSPFMETLLQKLRSARSGEAPNVESSDEWICELEAARRLATAAVIDLDRQKKGPARAKMVRIENTLAEIADSIRRYSAND